MKPRMFTSLVAHRSPRPAVQRSGEEGVALVVVLLLTVALSTIGASLLMLAQTDTYTSMNYRMMSQARYGAESGVLKAVNYLTQAYVTPGYAGDPYGVYDTTVSPVTFAGQPVVLSADPSKSNYPSAAVKAAFAAAAAGTLDAKATVSYSADATLVSMRAIQEYGATSPRVVMTWQVTAIGSLAGSRPATVEVESILERQVSAAHSFGVFATKIGCGALDFAGGSVNDSYDSTSMTMSGGVPVTQSFGASVGTNGNLTVNGSAVVHGTLSTPRTGVGKCKSGAITALTGGVASVSGGLIQLPQSLSYPTPDPPSPLPPTTNVNLGSETCASLSLSGTNCSGIPGDLHLDALGGTLSFGNVDLNANKVLHLHAGTYNLNSIRVNGGASIVIESGPVYLNIAGVGTTQPLDMMGGAISNATFDPTQFQILYGGTSAITLTGGMQTAAMVYAPNSDVTVAGGGQFYGSIVGSTVKDTGGAQFHYDRRLKSDFMVAGNYVMSSFTWRKY